MRKLALATTIAAFAIPSTALAQNTNPTFQTGRTICHSLPRAKVARQLGLPASASKSRIATAYAAGYRRSYRPEAYAGCYLGLR